MTCYTVKMGYTRRQQQLLAWIACFAILLSALAPTISNMVFANRGSLASLGQICREESAQSFGKADTKIKANSKGEHCPFCLAQSMTGLPSAPVLPDLGVTVSIVPPLFLSSRQPLFVWLSGQARAPPTIS